MRTRALQCIMDMRRAPITNSATRHDTQLPTQNHLYTTPSQPIRKNITHLKGYRVKKINKDQKGNKIIGSKNKRTRAVTAVKLRLRATIAILQVLLRLRAQGDRCLQLVFPAIFCKQYDGSTKHAA